MSDNQQQRSYGYSAKGGAVYEKIEKPTRSQKLRYYFDNTITKSHMLVLYLSVAIMLSIIAITLLQYYVLHTYNTIEECFWDTFAKMLQVGWGTTSGEAIRDVLIWIVGVAITGTVIGYMSAKIGKFIQSLSQGKTKIIEKDFILILGWCKSIIPILQQLAVANENVEDSLIVIFSNKDRMVMEEEITDNKMLFGNLRIITRSGNPSKPMDLIRVMVNSAKSIIILSEEGETLASTVTTTLSVMSSLIRKDIPVIVEVKNKPHAETLKAIYEDQIICVQSQSVITNVTAQASRQAGIATVVLDFLDFEGDELYFASIPEVVGKTYFEAQLCFEKSSVIGYIDEQSKHQLNPRADYVLKKNESLIAISESQDKVIFRDFTGTLIDKSLVTNLSKVEMSSEQILLIGWSSIGGSVVRKLTEFLKEHSKARQQSSFVDVLTLETFDTELELDQMSFNDIPLNKLTYDGEIEELSRVVKDKEYTAVIILGYQEIMNDDDADTQTLLTMLQLNKILSSENFPYRKPRIVTELIDSSKSDLANRISCGELVVSDNLLSISVAQLCQNANLGPIYKELFEMSDRASINIYPIDEYVELGSTITFEELVMRASYKGQSAIGYRVYNNQRNGTNGVELNPLKSAVFKIKKGDGLIVIS